MTSKIDIRMTQKLLWAPYPERMTEALDSLISTNWLILAVEQSRGHCNYNLKEITVPVWAMRREPEYQQWYLSHEMAHAFTKGDNHGTIFMARLKAICPPDAVQHEILYKPKNALMQGIGCFDF